MHHGSRGCIDGNALFLYFIFLNLSSSLCSKTRLKEVMAYWSIFLFLFICFQSLLDWMRIFLFPKQVKTPAGLDSKTESVCGHGCLLKLLRWTPLNSCRSATGSIHLFSVSASLALMVASPSQLSLGEGRVTHRTGCPMSWRPHRKINNQEHIWTI